MNKNINSDHITPNMQSYALYWPSAGWNECSMAASVASSWSSSR